MSEGNNEGPTNHPKVFISYSWTSPDHENWVLKLATDLRESGVDAILDKWHLREGNDSVAFMEKMVTDPQINKVLLVCDKKYTEKTNGRAGGVGTEAQIISAEIYQKQDQNKFVAVIREKDESGRPYLPVYYRSRIYIDLSDDTVFAENFDQLLRWAYDQPLFKEPELGQKPRFLVEDSAKISLSTSAKHRRAIEAIKNNRSTAIPVTAEYLEGLSSGFEKFRIETSASNTEFDDLVFENIEEFQPYRNEAIEVFSALAIYLDNIESRRLIHKFFESLIPYMLRPPSVRQYHEHDWDNFKFIIHELFLYAVAIYIHHERFESVSHLLNTRYFIPSDFMPEDNMPSFVVFENGLQSLAHRNRRLTLNRLSLHADLLKDRSKGSAVSFNNLQQADLVLFVDAFSQTNSEDSGQHHYWFPHTLALNSGIFELFARCRSKIYFDRIKIILGIKDKAELESRVANISGNRFLRPAWGHGFHSFNLAHLLQLELLATFP